VWSVLGLAAKTFKPKAFAFAPAKARYCQAVVHFIGGIDEASSHAKETLDYKPTQETLDVEYVIGGPNGYPMGKRNDFAAVLAAVKSDIATHVTKANDNWGADARTVWPAAVQKMVRVPAEAGKFDSVKISGVVNGSPQMTVGVPISRLFEFLKSTTDNKLDVLHKDNGEATKAEIDAINAAAQNTKPLHGLSSAGLGFLALLVRLKKAVYNSDLSYIKQGTRVMCRTNMGALYTHLPKVDKDWFATKGGGVGKNVAGLIAAFTDAGGGAVDDNIKLCGNSAFGGETDMPEGFKALTIKAWLTALVGGNDPLSGASGSMGKLAVEAIANADVEAQAEVDGLVVLEFRQLGNMMALDPFIAMATSMYNWVDTFLGGHVFLEQSSVATPAPLAASTESIRNRRLRRRARRTADAQ